jgi:hypothetical protein
MEDETRRRQLGRNGPNVSSVGLGRMGLSNGYGLLVEKKDGIASMSRISNRRECL